MSELLLINSAKRASGKKRKGRKSPRKSVARRSRVHRVGKSIVIGKAPVRRWTVNSRRRRSAFAKMIRRHRRNPTMPRFIGTMVDSLVPAFQGAAGAVLTDIAYRMVPLPGPLAILKGPLAPITQMLTAMLVGGVAGAVGGRRLGAQMTAGALTVIAYGLLQQHVVPRIFPQAAVGDYDQPYLGYYSAGLPVAGSGMALPESTEMNEYISGGVGEYISEYD